MAHLESSAILRWRRDSATPKICGMGVRRFVNELLLISPVLFIASITVQARTRTDTFEAVECSPTMQRRIAAYSEPVRLVEESLSSGIALASPNRLRQIGETWRNMTREGVLAPLRPEHSDDTCRDGVKAQVRIAADMLAAALQYSAHQASAAGDPYRAAQDAILAVEATQGVKYSDLYAIGTFAVRDNVSIRILEQEAPRLSQSQKKEILARLQALREVAKPLAEVVVATHRAKQIGATTPTILPKDFDIALRLAASEDRRVDQADFDSLFRKLARGIGPGTEDGFLPEFRFALTATRNFRKGCLGLEEKLG